MNDNADTVKVPALWVGMLILITGITFLIMGGGLMSQPLFSILSFNSMITFGVLP